MTPMPTSIPIPRRLEEVLDQSVKTVELTAEQQRKWEDTSSMMVWTAPGFRHIWYKLLNNNGGNHTAVMTNDVPIAATDGYDVLVNPTEFFKWGIAERTFIMAHEIVHNVVGDVELLHRCIRSGTVPMNDGGSLPFDNPTMQKSMDLRINAMLVKSRIGKMPMKDGKPFGHLDDKMDGTESVLDVYRKEFMEQFPDGKLPEGHDPNGDPNNPGGFDTLRKSKNGAPPRNQQQWDVEIKNAQKLEEQKSQGRMAAGLARMFKELLEPEIDWKDHITTLINRVGNSGGWNWREPDEWWVAHEFFSPKPSGHGAGWIVVWGDTSGSMGDKEIAAYISELGGILDSVNPQRLTVLWCDAEVDHVDELDEATDLAGLEPKGGGGTSVQPVFDWINESMDKPDLFIGFTDGHVSFPNAPDYPVIWASTTKDVKYPYGEVVRLSKNVAP
jgi:predicted metal-dependent peptidase